MAIRVIVAEDSYLVREGVVRLLKTQSEIEVAGACGDLDALLGMVEAEKPDVVLTDIRMPPTGTDEGVRAANTLRERHPSIGVVMLSQYAEPAYALALLEHGSAGRAYLLKERVSDIDQLLRAIREVADGRLGHRPAGRRDPRRGPLPPARLAAPAPHAPRARGAGRDGPGPKQRRHRHRARDCPNGPSRSTSTRCSPSSHSPRSPTGIGGSRRCSSTSPPTTDDHERGGLGGACPTCPRGGGPLGTRPKPDENGAVSADAVAVLIVDDQAPFRRAARRS